MRATIKTSSVVDGVDALTDAVICRSAVLDRLFELLSANRDKNGLRVDFGGHRDQEFYRGLRLLAEETIRDQETIKGLVQGLAR